ncbi:hypothetical protein HDU86_007856 [Geranomyces michiganensis]|nr:hypothetical protein HDU86_007856 [Geranomyces michiganensis]
MSDELAAGPTADEGLPSEPPSDANLTPAPTKPQASDVDLAIIVTPAQAVELNRRAEEIKNGYALLAMKRLENVFAGMDDENAGAEDGTDGEGQKNGGIDLQAEEEKLNAAMASYAQQMEECGIPNGSPEYLAALEALTAAANAAVETEQGPEPVEQPARKVALPVESLPYHDVWNHKGDKPAADVAVPVVVAEVHEAVEEPAEVPSEAAVVEPSAPPVEEAPVVVSNPAIPPTKATKKPLPPVVVRPTRGRGRGIPVARQSIPARTLALSFSTFPTSFPNDAPSSLPPQTNGPQFAAPVVMSNLTFNSSNGYQQRGHHPQQHPPTAPINRTATATSISQLPLDASSLRAVHPVSSSSSKTGVAPLGAGLGQRTTTAGGAARPGIGTGLSTGAGMMVMNTGSPSTGRYGWGGATANNNQQQQNSSSSSKRVAGSQLVGGVSQVIVGGTGIPSAKIVSSAAAAGTEAAAVQNAIASPAASMSLAPRTAPAIGPGGGGGSGPSVGAGLPPIRNSPAPTTQKLALHAGGAVGRRAGAGAPP